MSATVKRALGAVAVVAGVIVAGLEVKGFIPTGTAALVNAALIALGWATPSPVIRTGQ